MIGRNGFISFVIAILVGSAACADVAKTQRQLIELGYEAGEVDGLWGRTTRYALEAFLADKGEIFDGTLDLNETDMLAAELDMRGLNIRPNVDWKYRATSFGFGGYNRADQPVYDAIQTISEIPAYGFNVLTLDISCVDELDDTAPNHYPLGRRIGCSISNKQILEEEGFVSNRRDATDLAIDEARAVGLAINLKPMFLSLSDKYGDGLLSTDAFFSGDMPIWSGYVSRIMAIAKYAQQNQIEYLTIGTELNNLNVGLEDDTRWVGIIKQIRTVYDGKLIYAHNFGNESNLQQLSSSNVMRYVDIVGLNFFPSRIVNGRIDYSAEEIALGLRRARLKNGRNMMVEAQALQSNLQVPVILSETHFPTWQGSANWIFRGSCDYEHEGKRGWNFTQGPLQPKKPSDASGRLLAEGFMLAFEDQEWVHGADYLYWTYAFLYDPETDTAQYVDCASMLYEKNNGIKELIRDFHGD